mgnify:CR=1 FL=1
MHYELINSSLVPGRKSTLVPGQNPKLLFVPLFFCLKNTVFLFKKIKSLLVRET